MNSSDAHAILINLISEAIAIAITVSVIDRILEREEKARWRPSKGMVYADRVKIVSDLLAKTLPESLWLHEMGLYSFGSASGITGIRLRKKSLSLDDPYLPLQSAKNTDLEHYAF